MKRRTMEQHPPELRVPADNVPIVAPVYNSAKYTLPSLADVESLFRHEREGFFYSRVANPTVRKLEQLLARLQGREQAVCFPSGLAAISVTLLSLLSSNDHVILFREGYGPTRYLIRNFLRRYGVSHSILGRDDIDSLDQHIVPGRTKLIIFESPTNPTTRIFDIGKLERARERGVLLIMDNTFAGFHNHGQFAIDLFIHSLTKFAGGHSDLMGGVVIGSGTAIETVIKDSIHLGACFSPDLAALVLRSMKTYSIRYETQCRSALELASRLVNHPKVQRVWYPGLSSHPDYDLASTQLRDFGCVISLDIRGGGLDLRKFVDALSFFKLAASLGCTESLVAPSRLFYGRDFSESECEEVALLDSTVRLSIGLEDVDDIWEDLEQALTCVDGSVLLPTQEIGD